MGEIRTADAWRDQMREIYSSGDTEALAKSQEPLALALLEAARIRPGDRVLDIGAGTGTVALEAARRGAEVTAVDLTPHQVEIGRARSAAEGLDVVWHVADTESLPCESGAFDIVLSSFGIIYAANPRTAAAETTRVLSPSGRVLFTAFPADSFNGQVLKVIDSYTNDGATAFVDENEWAEQSSLDDWFAPRTVTLDRRTHPAPLAESLDAWWQAMADVPVVAHLSATLSAAAFETFAQTVREIRARFADFEPDGAMFGRNDYVIATVA